MSDLRLLPFPEDDDLPWGELPPQDEMNEVLDEMSTPCSAMDLSDEELAASNTSFDSYYGDLGIRGDA